MIGIRIMTRWHSFNQRNYNLSKLRVNIEVCSEGNTTRIAAPRNHNMFRKHGDAGRYIFIWRAVINRDDFYYLVKHADNTCGCNSVQSLSTVFFFRAVSHPHVRAGKIYHETRLCYREDRRAASMYLFAYILRGTKIRRTGGFF